MKSKPFTDRINPDTTETAFFQITHIFHKHKAKILSHFLKNHTPHTDLLILLLAFEKLNTCLRQKYVFYKYVV